MTRAPCLNHRSLRAPLILGPALLSLALMAACGADGAPQPPGQPDPASETTGDPSATPSSQASGNGGTITLGGAP